MQKEKADAAVRPADRQTNRQIDGQSDRQTGSEARRMCHGFHCSLNTHSFHGATDAVAVALAVAVAVAVAHTKAAHSTAAKLCEGPACLPCWGSRIESLSLRT